jgi:hypothetical protein
VGRLVLVLNCRELHLVFERCAFSAAERQGGAGKRSNERNLKALVYKYELYSMGYLKLKLCVKMLRSAAAAIRNHSGLRSAEGKTVPGVFNTMAVFTNASVSILKSLDDDQTW